MATAREKVKMVSTADTGYFKVTTVKKGAEKLLQKMFDPVIRKHVEFKQSKMK